MANSGELGVDPDDYPDGMLVLKYECMHDVSPAGFDSRLTTQVSELALRTLEYSDASPLSVKELWTGQQKGAPTRTRGSCSVQQRFTCCGLREADVEQFCDQKRWQLKSK